MQYFTFYMHMLGIKYTDLISVFVNVIIIIVTVGVSACITGAVTS